MFITKKLSLILCAASLPMLVATAQDAPAKEGRPGFGPGPGGFGRGGERRIMQGFGQPSGLIFARMLSNPEFIKGLGLPDETVAKLTEGLKKIEEQERALREEMDKLRKSQTELLAALMSDRTKTGEEVREISSKIDEIHGKIFNLGVDRMLLIRDNLTDEQIKQAGEQVKKNFDLRREEMMRRRGGPDGQRPRGPRDGGRRGPPPEGGPKDDQKDGPKDTPPPPPPPPEAPKAE